MAHQTAADKQSKDRRQLVRLLYRSILRRDADEANLEHMAASLECGETTEIDLVKTFMQAEEYKMLDVSRFFAPPGHFYSPIVDTREARTHLDALASQPAPDALPGIALDRDAMVELWHDLLPLLQSAPFTEGRQAGYRYHYDNPAYSYGDGSVLHAMLRLTRPKRVIEIGSGWSSACTLDTVEKSLDGACALTFIEPYPALLKELMGHTDLPVTILEHGVQNTPLERFDALEAGDILFIDSTHVLKTGSDVWFELTQVLPRLKPGVLVHLHDMFWPFEYPPQWVLDENRSWNEAYAVRAFLTDNRHWRVEFFNNYLFSKERALIEATFPLFLRNSGGALWLRKTG